jgi:Fe-S-cluster formation regulator IscX/YfhJ
MLARDQYLDRVTTEVEEVASRVALLKGRFAKQKVSVKLDHYWELDYVRTRFTEFKRRIQQLEDADDPELPRIQENVDLAWKDLLQAVDTLMTALH